MRLWPDARVPYSFGANLKPSERELIRKALTSIESQSRVRFTEDGTAGDRVTFRLDGSSHSVIGQRGGDQTIGLTRPITRRKVLHEVLHALGVHHEHTRPGRDEYITIHTENAVDPSAANDLRAVEERRDHREYDYASIMHYPTDAFAKLGLKTIVPKRPLPPGVTLGKGQALSAGDVKTLELLYPSLPTS